MGGTNPLHYRAVRNKRNVERPKGPVVGIITGAEFEIQQAQLEYGDSLIGYTDGVTEALSPQKAFFTKEKVSLGDWKPRSRQQAN